MSFNRNTNIKNLFNDFITGKISFSSSNAQPVQNDSIDANYNYSQNQRTSIGSSNVNISSVDETRRRYFEPSYKCNETAFQESIFEYSGLSMYGKLPVMLIDSQNNLIPVDTKTHNEITDIRRTLNDHKVPLRATNEVYWKIFSGLPDIYGNMISDLDLYLNYLSVIKASNYNLLDKFLENPKRLIKIVDTFTPKNLASLITTATKSFNDRNFNPAVKAITLILSHIDDMKGLELCLPKVEYFAIEPMKKRISELSIRNNNNNNNNNDNNPNSNNNNSNNNNHQPSNLLHAPTFNSDSFIQDSTELHNEDDGVQIVTHDREVEIDNNSFSPNFSANSIDPEFIQSFLRSEYIDLNSVINQNKAIAIRLDSTAILLMTDQCSIDELTVALYQAPIHNKFIINPNYEGQDLIYYTLTNINISDDNFKLFIDSFPTASIRKYITKINNTMIYFEDLNDRIRLSWFGDVGQILEQQLEFKLRHAGLRHFFNMDKSSTHLDFILTNNQLREAVSLENIFTQMLTTPVSDPVSMYSNEDANFSLWENNVTRRTEETISPQLYPDDNQNKQIFQIYHFN